MSVIPGKLPKLPALDGVRGVAVIAVVAYHLSTIDVRPSLFPGGYLGVDAFFVLSAFLITALLLTESRAAGGRIEFRSFYWHRLFRLAPALVVFLALLGPTVATRIHAADIGSATVASLFYVMDFAAAGILIHHPPPLDYRHLWSLSVEEQFYFLWPVTLGLLARRLGHTARMWLLFGAAIAAWVVQMLSHAVIGADRTYFFLTGHLFPLAVGALAAELAVHGVPPRLERLLRSRQLAWLSAVGFVLTWLGWRGGLARAADFGPTVVVCGAVGIVVLHVVLEADGRLARLLGTAPLRWLGARSYGLYLYHLPILLLLLPPSYNGSIPLHLRIVVTIAASLAAAELSYRYVESPIRRWGRTWADRRDVRARWPVRAAEPIRP